MSQVWTPPSGTSLLSVAVKTDLPAMLESLRTGFSGATAPSSASAYQQFINTTTNRKQRRNAANSAWVDEAPLLVDVGMELFRHPCGTVNATTTFRLAWSHVAGRVLRLGLWSSVTSTSSSGNEWQFTLTNRTTAAALFSGTVGTFTSLGGVGGGAEITANTIYILTPNQNTSLNANALVDLAMTKVGAATSLTDVTLFLEWTRTA